MKRLLLASVALAPFAAHAQDVRLKTLFTPEQYGADPTGTTDATAAIQKALNDAATLHGVVQMCGRYLQNSANITQPQSVAVTGCSWNYPGASWTGRNYSGTPSTIIQNPSFTWNEGNDDRIANLTFQRSGIGNGPSSYAALVAIPSAFAGTAVTLTGSDNAIDDVLFLGYATCVNTTGQARYKFHRANGDCTQGFNVASLYDWASIDDSEMYPYLTYNTQWANSSWPVTAETTSGGQVVLTIGSPAVSGTALTTGMLINVSGITGQPSLTNRWTITVSGSQVTLNGSSLTPSTTGTLSTTSAVVPVASTANLGAGQTVAGTGIPASTTVLAVNTLASSITLSALPTTAGSGVSLAFSTPAYTSGGTIWFNELRRTGDGITLTNAGGLTTTSFRELGHDVGIHATTGAQGNIFVGPQTDNEVSTQDPTTIAFLQDGTGAFSLVQGGFLNSDAYGIVNNQSGGYVQPSVFNGTTIAATNGGYGIWTNFGRTSIVGSPASASGPQIYVGSSASELQLCGDDWQGLPTIQYQAAIDAQFVTGCDGGAAGMLRADAGTGAGPRLKLTGSADLNAYFLINGPTGIEWFGSSTYGYPFAVQLPSSGVIVNSVVANGATSGTSPAVIYANGGPLQIKGAGSNLTELGSNTSLSQIQGAQGLASTSAVTFTPSTGGTITFTANESLYLVQGSATLGSLTIDYPASPTDRQELCVVNQPAISALTVASLGTATFDTSPTGLPAHSELCYRYWASIGANGTWVNETISSTVPIATTSVLGGIKPDGTTITVNGAGVASAVGGSATSVVVGTTTVGGGTNNTLLFDNSGALGVATVGSGLSLSGGTLTATGSGYTLPNATTSTLGGVKPDGSTTQTSSGVLSVIGGPSLTTIAEASTPTVITNANVVITSGTGGVQLSYIGAGVPIKVRCRLTIACTIYPPSSGQIEALGTNVAATLNPGNDAEYAPTSATQFYW